MQIYQPVLIPSKCYVTYLNDSATACAFAATTAAAIFGFIPRTPDISVDRFLKSSGNDEAGNPASSAAILTSRGTNVDSLSAKITE